MTMPAAATGTISTLGTEIIAGKNATHIAGIAKDTINVIAGHTYAHTVDTPEGEGLVSTKPDIKSLLLQIVSKDGSQQTYKIVSEGGEEKTTGDIVKGDQLIVTSQNGKATRAYIITLHRMALIGKLQLAHETITVKTPGSLKLFFTAGQRSPDASVRIYIPAGITVTTENTTVNVIGRGVVKLKDLHKQSIGRVGNRYSYTSVGEVSITKSADGGSLITFKNLDLRPANGPDLVIVIADVNLPNAGKYTFKASYAAAKPEVFTSPGTGSEIATLAAVETISDLERVIDRGLLYKESPNLFRQLTLKWSKGERASNIQLKQSMDDGKTWKTATANVDVAKCTATVSGLEPDKLYTFRLAVRDGVHKGFSNQTRFYTGKMDIKNFGATGEDDQDNTDEINEAISYLHELGGGTLLFSAGVYSVRTIHLKSNVYLYIHQDATIKALKGGDAPETTWFSDKKYRSGLSPTDTGPYEDPENYLTKQDVGHTFFRNTMFFGERLDNVKIIGNGVITGDGNLVTGDKVMNNAPDNRADKMFTFKLCTNIEIGGIYRDEDLWYDADKDEPYYIKKDGARDFNIDNMLQIDRGGHFVLLATGTDNINVHNTYFGKHHTSNSRDIYDFMACNNVTVTNIYCKVTSDDIVKPGSDCSLGFTRPAANYKVRNVIGDTNCNLFQIGSETADDIVDVHVDNIYVLGANKAGFSISTNDGGHIKDIHLNCGHTGTIHARSKMLRTFAPFFISISNRGRILGADVARYEFIDNGMKRSELLVKNVNIGQVENIILNAIDVSEVYAGSAFRGARWKPYDGSQRRATAIIAGYRLPGSDSVAGGLDFRLPNGNHTGYIKNVQFNDVHILVKGGNPLADTLQSPPELGVGQYNVSNLKTQPAYGLWARHVANLDLKNCTFNYERVDGRYVLFLNDVLSAKISSVKMVRPKDNKHVIKLKDAHDVTIDNTIYYNDRWGESAQVLIHKADSNTNGNEALPERLK